MSLRRIIFSCPLVIVLSGCWSTPYVVEPIQEKDDSLSCEQLESEVRQAIKYKVDARAEDKFMWKHMLIVPPMISEVNFNRAESAAKKRIEHLLGLANQKKCEIHTAPADADIPPERLPSLPQQSYY